MNMIDAHKIVYNILSSEEFDVTPHLSFGTDNGAISSFLGREGVYTEYYDGHRAIHRVKHNEVLTPRFTLVKKDFSDFSPSENRRILSWLTASDKPGWLEVYKDDSNIVEWKIFGYTTSVEQYKLGNNRVVGYEFEVESSHPYAWSRKWIYPEVHSTTEEINNNNEDNDYLAVSGTEEFTITCNSDDYNKVIYPRITIVFSGKNPYFPVSINPTTDNAYHMVPNVIYSLNNTQYFVSLNGAEDKGRFPIGIITDSIPPKVTSNNLQNFQDYDYYYFPNDGDYLRKLQVKDDGTTIEWVTVAHIGMAVKISNKYVLNGKVNTAESIIAGGTKGETIVLNGANKIISGTTGSTTRIIGDDFNWEWIPLADGDNDITVMGNCHIKFEWLEPRKVGSL